MPATSKITFKTHISRLEYLLSVHYLEVPKRIVKQLGGKLNVRLLCTVNNSLTFQCGLVALGEGKAYISINNSRMKKLGLKNGYTVTVSLEKDKSKYGMEMPEELKEVLEIDAEGKRRFELLVPGKQRYIIHYVSTVKNSQLRIDRALMLIGNLKQLPVGKESFREMLGAEKKSKYD